MNHGWSICIYSIRLPISSRKALLIRVLIDEKLATHFPINNWLLQVIHLSKMGKYCTECIVKILSLIRKLISIYMMGSKTATSITSKLSFSFSKWWRVKIGDPWAVSWRRRSAMFGVQKWVRSVTLNLSAVAKSTGSYAISCARDLGKLFYYF